MPSSMYYKGTLNPILECVSDQIGKHVQTIKEDLIIELTKDENAAWIKGLFESPSFYLRNFSKTAIEENETFLMEMIARSENIQVRMISPTNDKWFTSNDSSESEAKQVNIFCFSPVASYFSIVAE